MKVLHVIPSFAPAWRYGGPVRAAYDMCRELTRRGADITVFTTNINGPNDLPVPVDRPVDMGGFSVRYFQIRAPRRFSFSPSLARGLREHIRSFDLVHIHSVFNWPVTQASYWSRRFRVPYLYRPCGMLDPVAVEKPFEGKMRSIAAALRKRLYLRLLEQRNIDGAEALHFTSRQEMELAQWVRPRARGFVCPLGVTPPSFDRYLSRAELGLPIDKPVVLFLSRLDPKKGLDLLAAALAQIRDDYVFAIAGGGEVDSAKEQVARAGMQNRTVWLGPLDGCAKWSAIREADVFVLASYQENFGQAVVEAMLMGRPVIVSDRVGIHSEIAEAGAGIVVPCNVEAVREAVLYLLHHAEVRKEMGVRAAWLAQNRFDWSRVADSLIREYENILAGKRVVG